MEPHQEKQNQLTEVAFRRQGSSGNTGDSIKILTLLSEETPLYNLIVNMHVALTLKILRLESRIRRN